MPKDGSGSIVGVIYVMLFEAVVKNAEVDAMPFGSLQLRDTRAARALRPRAWRPVILQLLLALAC